MNGRWLYLGGGRGWHFQQTRDALACHGYELVHASYESLAVEISGNRVTASCQCEPLEVEGGTKAAIAIDTLADFAGVLTRTMPAGNLETITTRLAILHDLEGSPGGPVLVNSPRTLEWAIDKLTTLAIVTRLGFDVPDTRVVQSRGEALRAFDELGGDVVVKPLFGGEGRGIMHLSNRELAWTAFSALDELQRVFYIQKFIAPIDRELRVLKLGDRHVVVSRDNQNDFRSNASQGGRIRTVKHVQQEWIDLTEQIARRMNLFFGSIDFVLDSHGKPSVIEVNAVPGWRYTQAVYQDSIAGILADELVKSINRKAAKLHTHDKDQNAVKARGSQCR